MGLVINFKDIDLLPTLDKVGFWVICREVDSKLDYIGTEVDGRLLININVNFIVGARSGDVLSDFCSARSHGRLSGFI